MWFSELEIFWSIKAYVHQSMSRVLPDSQGPSEAVFPSVVSARCLRSPAECFLLHWVPESLMHLVGHCLCGSFLGHLYHRSIFHC